MSGETDKSQYVLPLDQPVVSLEVSTAFSQLNKKERLYAHYLSQGSWIGGLITLLQTSPESGPIFVLLHKLFSAQDPNKFRTTALAHGFSESEVISFFVYSAGVFTNAGNYKGFGDTKFVPAMEPHRFEQLIKLSPVWADLEVLWNTFNLSKRLFDLSEGHTCLGFPPQGCTTYFSSNCGPEDSLRVQKWMKKENLECYNTRVFKKESTKDKIIYEIRLASEQLEVLKVEDEGLYTYRLVKGDYAPLMGILNQTLEKALFFANPTEKSMIEAYISSFKTGSIDDHKKGSRFWIKNKSPAIETYIGFIETYRDPAGVRGEFEGFVAIVNRAMSEKFSALVNSAEKFLEFLPWPKEFEKDTFLRPDFTSLDILTFAGSGIPAGINIPNYDDIRQGEGFKNVSLGNVIPASYQYSKTPFLLDEDASLFKDWRVLAFELQVGLHELLGHGSGKLLKEEPSGTKNFSEGLINPITKVPIASWYHPGDTYDAKFGPISSSYEECRAEAVGLFLSLDPNVLEIFGHKGADADNVTYVNWLSLIWAGAGRALEMWEPGRGWLQAHAQARYVITRVLVEAGVAKVSQPTKDDLLITLDRACLKSAGREAISNFLLKLQVFKATGDVEAATKLFNQLSNVEEPWLGWRSIVLANKQPRNMLIQSNTIKNGDDVELHTYKSTIEGLIESWIERFTYPEPLYTAITESVSDDYPFFM